MSVAETVIRVVIADDHPTERMGIRAALHGERDIAVVGEAQDGAEAMQLVADLCPDILALDLVMPGPRASEVERSVRSHHPETTTLVLTAHDRDCFLAKMVDAGVKGFLTKDESPARLADAIRRAALGEIVITGEQRARARRWQEEAGARWASLTGRGLQALRLLGEGLSNREIARSLCVAVKDGGVSSHQHPEQA